MGYDLASRTWNGYQGTASRHVFYGVRHDGAYLRLSGEPAHVWWRDAWQIAGRCSRLDVQATIEGVRAGRDLAREARNAADRAPKLKGRPVEWQYLETRAKGCTAYVGSRTSARFLRLYDKGAEERTGHLTGRWRYEVELKDDIASGTARALHAAPDQGRASAAYVYHQFDRRSVRPLFRPPGPDPDVEIRSGETDDERRLRWLREQVSITVARLMANGREADVRAALRLP